MSQEAEENILIRIDREGLLSTVTDGHNLIQLTQQPLDHYLNRFGHNLDKLSLEGAWPSRVLRVGACLTMLAYYQSGYDVSVDEDALAAGSLLADLGGVPDTFTVSASLDPLLTDFNQRLKKAELLQDDEGGVAQVMSIGSGIVRHYLQQAIAA